MNHKLKLLSGIAVLFISSCSESYQKPNELIKEVSFTKVSLNDSFWLTRIETNRTVSIPSAFSECEKNGRFDNFALAGGLIKGEHQGDFSFDDTDPYKIIEGASYSLAVKYDEKLDHYLDSVITLISSAQEADGYLTTCVTNKCERLSGWWGRSKWEKINSHELYNCGHLYEAAVAHYEATGKRSLLDVALKNADLICDVFGPNEGQKHVPSGHPIVEMGLAKLYKVTGEKRYLELAKYFVEETGRGTDGHRLNEYSQDHKPILLQDEIVGHAVRAGYLYSGVADVAALNDEDNYFQALCRIWENMAGRKLYITGGIGSRPQGEGFGPDYELNNHTGYCETCASIANVYWNHRMFLSTGDSKYIDVLERALYNGVISGVSLSGDKFFYDNPLESMGQHERQKWFGCACCPGNVTRFIASVPKYVYATQKDDIYVNLYIQSKSDITTMYNQVYLEQKTEFPWDGTVKLVVNPENEDLFALRLRVPGWINDKPVATDLYSYVQNGSDYTIKLNGKSINPEVVDGYITLNRVWSKNDVVEVNYPMEVRQVKANDKVEDNVGKRSIERGPIVYCIEGTDQNDNYVFNKYIPENAEFTSTYDKDLLNGVMVVTAKGKEIEDDGKVKDVTLKAIPYSTWNNRGKNQMVVWIPDSETYAHCKPNPTIASKARSFMFQNAIQKDAPESAAIETWAEGVNDQWEPKSSSDISKPYHYWWLKVGSLETIAYEFEKPETVSSVEVYWLDIDHYDGNFRVPESWKLYAKQGNQWKEIKSNDHLGVKKDCYNIVNFEPINTTGLRIEAQLQKNASGGILEWKVK